MGLMKATLAGRRPPCFGGSGKLVNPPAVRVIRHHLEDVTRMYDQNDLPYYGKCRNCRASA